VAEPQRALPDAPPFTAIWDAVRAIPRGEWASYGEVARRAGLPRAARLVGYALRHAPAGLDLPWHRVVGAGGRISLPAGSSSRTEQLRRLAAEGVTVRAGRIRPALDHGDPLDALLWRPKPRVARRRAGRSG
jgi:methylated-DNA-protein-cysteine methyltransferase-like protein